MTERVPFGLERHKLKGLTTWQNKRWLWNKRGRLSLKCGSIIDAAYVAGRADTFAGLDCAEYASVRWRTRDLFPVW